MTTYIVQWTTSQSSEFCTMTKEYILSKAGQNIIALFIIKYKTK